MKPQSAKGKGRTLQKYVRDRLLAAFSMLEEDDIQSRSMGASGEDLQLSPAARRLIPFSFECANQEHVNVWAKWKQAEANSGKYDTVVCIKRNRVTPKVIIDLDVFIALLRKVEPFK